MKFIPFLEEKPEIACQNVVPVAFADNNYVYSLPALWAQCRKMPIPTSHDVVVLNTIGGSKQELVTAHFALQECSGYASYNVWRSASKTTSYDTNNAHISVETYSPLGQDIYDVVVYRTLTCG